MSKYKYQQNTYLGPCNIYFKERLDTAKGIFLCPLCGKEFQSQISNIVSGNTKSCGCLNLKKMIQENTRIGPYNILFKQRLNDKKGVFECNYCKKDFVTDIASVSTGRTRSCGCYAKKYKPGDMVGPYKIKMIKRLRNSYGIFQCPVCHKNFKSCISSISSGRQKTCGCNQYCVAKKNGRTRIKNLVGKKFGLLTVIEESEKRNGGNHILWKCQCDCGNFSFVRTSDLLTHKVISCGCSKLSSGEYKIKELLESLNLSFEMQKTFYNCKNPKTNTKLRFDFYLPDYNCCIEYDGEQHYKETTMCSDSLSDRQFRDNIKNKFCKDNEIKLIRIPYTDFKKLNLEYLKNKIFDK